MNERDPDYREVERERNRPSRAFVPVRFRPPTNLAIQVMFNENKRIHDNMAKPRKGKRAISEGK